MSEPYEKNLVYVDIKDFERYLFLSHKDYDKTITDEEKAFKKDSCLRPRVSEV